MIICKLYTYNILYQICIDCAGDDDWSHRCKRQYIKSGQLTNVRTRPKKKRKRDDDDDDDDEADEREKQRRLDNLARKKRDLKAKKKKYLQAKAEYKAMKNGAR